MRILFIGGTGNISMACTRLAIERGHEVFLLNRGKTKRELPKGAQSLVADINKADDVKAAIGNLRFDVVANFIAFTPADIERDIALFEDKTKQYIFISSASAYQKPVGHPIVTESTPLINPYWDYSRDKIACEDRLTKAFRETGFPFTIIRPSLTYDTVIPVAIGSWDDYTIVDRMKRGKEVIVHGDGTSLWTVTHSRDFAKGFVGLLGHQQAIGHAFHITSDEILTWDLIYQAVAEAVGVEAKIVHIASDFICKVADSIDQSWMRGNLLGDKAQSVIFDNSKIKQFVPEFKATIPFKQGIKCTVDWFEADPSRIRIEEGNNNFIDTVLQAYNAKK